MNVIEHATDAELLTVADEIAVILWQDMTRTYKDIVRHNAEVGWQFARRQEPVSLSEADLRRAWEMGAGERAAIGYAI